MAELLIALAAITVAAGFYWYGHFSVWGKLSKKYSAQTVHTRTDIAPNYENIGIRVNGRWEGGMRARCFSTPSGIFFETGKLLRAISPPVFVPWCDIASINISNNGFMGTSRIEIRLKDDGISILIPKNCNIECPNI